MLFITQTLKYYTSHSPAAPSFNATILSSSGHDITSSFQIRLFQPPIATNLTGRDTASIHLINYCPIASESFVASYCNNIGGVQASLQSFTRICRQESGRQWRRPGGRSPYIPQTGFCNVNEICITLTRENQLGRAPVAACVNRVAYQTCDALQQLGASSGEEATWVRRLRLSGMRVWAAASQLDESTPLQMKTLEIEAGKKGSEVGREVCSDCLGLRTESLPVGTESLKVEATLMTAGVGVVAGILWVAVLAG